MKQTTTLLIIGFFLCLLSNLTAQDFRVQIAAYAEAMPDTFFREKGIPNVIASTDQMGMHRYFVGSCSTREEAEKVQQEMIGKGFSFALVVDLEEQRVLSGAGCPEGNKYMKDSKRGTAQRSVYFDFGSCNLSADAIKELDDVCQKLKENPSLQLRILGHTDGVGNPQANMELAASRSRSVRNCLINKGVRADRMFMKVFGEAEPDKANSEESLDGKKGEDLPENRKWNRRVVLEFMDDAGKVKTEDAISGGGR